MRNLTNEELATLRRVREKSEAVKETQDLTGQSGDHGFIVTKIDMEVFEKERANYLERMSSSAS